MGNGSIKTSELHPGFEHKEMQGLHYTLLPIGTMVARPEILHMPHLLPFHPLDYYAHSHQPRPEAHAVTFQQHTSMSSVID